MKDVSARVQMIVGQAAGGICFTDMEYDPYECAVLFRDPRGKEIPLNPLCLRGMVHELTDFVKVMSKLDVKVGRD